MKLRNALLFLAALALWVAPADARTRKCHTDMIAYEHPTTGKLHGYYYVSSFPWGDADSANCNCDDGVFVQYYVGLHSTTVTLGTVSSLCTGTGPFYLYVPIAAGQDLPPAGARFVYTHGQRTWNAPCGLDEAGKIDCSNSGVEFAEW